MSLVVGTSGWSYPEWQPDFYPPKLPKSAFLPHYASRLTGCEINATFYRLQSEAAVGRWADGVPEDFRFVAKAHRRLTHTSALPPADGGDEFMERFLSSLAPLGARLGAVLLQLPPTRRRDDAALAGLMGCLPGALPFAVEFRHPSWDAPEVSEAVAAAGGTVCMADTAGSVPDALPPGPLAYVRLRSDHYPEEARSRWAELLAREARTRPVFVFTKHEGVPAGDPHAGVGLAEWLVSRAGTERAAPHPAAG